MDTEGLRSPELEYKEQQTHNNELATFVIGLADLTIFNVFGETPGELTDILQTAIHAFIRMKNVEMQLSCHFVHQNVSAVLANSKSKFGRQYFQDRLDFMTNTAAKLEKCEGKFRSFQDVIKFNNETDVTLMCSLWKGDPPMAPINSNYSYGACTLKEAIVISIKGKESHCNFAAFQSRVKTLWYAVLQEKFVFNFKNTMEITAYNELDAKYSQWCWDLQHKTLKWQHQVGNQISSCGILDINFVLNHCLLEIDQDFDDVYLRLNEKLVEFFEESERSETLSQWRTSTKVKLKNLCEKHKQEAIKYCTMLHQNHDRLLRLDQCKEQLRAKIIGLASDVKNLALTAKTRKEIFNQQWERWIRDLISQSRKSGAYASAEHMEMKISQILENMYTAHSHLIMQGLQAKALSKRCELKLEITHSHLNSSRRVNNVSRYTLSVASRTHNQYGNQYADVNDEDFHHAKVQTDIFFHEVEESIAENMERCQDFNEGLVLLLLINLKRSIDKFNDGKNNFLFTPHYQVDIAITVSGYVYQKFVTKVKQLAFQNDPAEAINRLKPIFFQIFETQFL